MSDYISKEDNNELSIERVMNEDKEGPTSPASLSSKLLAQQQSMEEEIKKEALEREKLAEDNAEESIDGDGGDGDSGEGGEESSSEDIDIGDTSFDDPAEEEKDEEESSSSEDKDGEESAEETGEGEGEKDSDVSTESFTTPYGRKLNKSWDIFSPMISIEEKRTVSLESFGLLNFSLEEAPNQETSEQDGKTEKSESEKNIQSIDESSPVENGSAPVAYTKEAIVESIKNLGEINRKYLVNSTDFVKKVNESIPKLQERVINFQRYFDNKNFEYTNKLISDVSVLKGISTKGNSSIRDSLKKIRKYSKDSVDISNLIVNSDFEQLKDAFNTRGFVDKGEVLDYAVELPGFVSVKVSIPEFKNYIKTKIADYQYYKVKEESPSEMYNLTPISITQDTDLDYYVKNLKELILSLGLSVDVLTKVVEEFNKFMEELKVLRVGVEDNEFEKLSELGLDEKVQQFIIYKLVVELVSVNINISIDYLTSFITVLEETVVFKDIAKEIQEEKKDDEEEGVENSEGDGEPEETSGEEEESFNPEEDPDEEDAELSDSAESDLNL